MLARAPETVAERRGWIAALVAVGLLLATAPVEAKRRRRPRTAPNTVGTAAQTPSEDDLDSLDLAPIQAVPPLAPEPASAVASPEKDPLGLELIAIEVPPHDLRSPWSNPVLWVLGGLGVASVGAGGFFAVRSRAHYADAAAATVQVDRRDLNDDGRLAAIIANSLFGAGALLLGGASAMVFLQLSEAAAPVGVADEGAKIQSWGGAWRFAF